MKKAVLLFFTITFISSSLAFAMDDPIVFPKENQADEQKEADASYCRDWARTETGVDADYIKAKIEQMQEREDIFIEDKYGDEPILAGILKRAARGAATGAIDDAFNENTEVATQAVTGVLEGLLDSTSENKENTVEKDNYYNSKSIIALQKQYQRYFRAFSACMDAKGYSVR